MTKNIKNLVVSCLSLSGCFIIQYIVSIHLEGVEKKATDQWSNNRAKLEELKYNELTYSTVLLGSSVSEKVIIDDTLNTALSGESVHDGLRVLLASGNSPEVCLIEVNVIDRPPSKNSEIVADSDWNEVYLFQKRNSPSTLLLSYVRTIAEQQKPGARYTGSQFQPVNNDDHIDINRKKLLLYNRIPQQSTPVNFQGDKELFDGFINNVNTLKKRGIKVIFYEVPYEPELDQLNRARSIRDWIKSEFKNDVFLQPHAAYFNTSDGIHLTDYAIALFSKELEREYKEVD